MKYYISYNTFVLTQTIPQKYVYLSDGQVRSLSFISLSSFFTSNIDVLYIAFQFPICQDVQTGGSTLCIFRFISNVNTQSGNKQLQVAQILLFWVVWQARAVMQVFAILMQYPTFEGYFFHIQKDKINTKLEFLYIDI